MFLNAQQVRTLILNDPDGYFSRFSELDMRARKASSIHSYLTRAIGSIREFSNVDKMRLDTLCRYVDRWLATHTDLTEKYGVNGETASTIPWSLALTRSDEYEDGLPHTRNKVIFITTNILRLSDIEVTSTLLHEKVHLYQKAFPHVVEAFLRRRGFHRVKPIDEERMRRINPDTDRWMYVYHNKMPMLSVYKSSNPKGIADVINDREHEHPYEWMAYSIERAFNETQSF